MMTPITAITEPIKDLNVGLSFSNFIEKGIITRGDNATTDSTIPAGKSFTFRAH